MKTNSITLLITISLAAFAGCKNKEAGDPVAQMTELKDRVCACKDRACAQAVAEQLTRTGSKQDNAKLRELSDADAKKIAAITEELTRCMTKFTSGLEVSSPGAGVPAAATAVPFKKFATDLMTVDDLGKIYPAGKRFTLAAILKTAPDCSQSGECRIELSDGAKTYKSFSIDLANKTKLDGMGAGAEISLDCEPVYEQGAYDPKPTLQFDKSCTVR